MLGKDIDPYKTQIKIRVPNEFSTIYKELKEGDEIVSDETLKQYVVKKNKILTSNMSIAYAFDSDIIEQVVPSWDAVSKDDAYMANTWDLTYWADEEDDRVIGMNNEKMTMDSEIYLTAGAHAGSVDRCAMTHKLYVRTAADDHKWIEVVDAVTRKWLKKIPLPQKPRSSGGYNKYRDMMAVSTKTYPWVVLIDATTDKVLFQDGHDTGVPHGNDGTNATGHTVWLDANTFALLDRHTPDIKIYSIKNAMPPYDVVLSQTIPTPTGCHSLRSVEAGHLFSDRVFYAAIEGELGTGVKPQMWKMTFDSDTGQLSDPATAGIIELDGYGDAGSIHHFGISGDGKTMIVPVSNKNGTDGIAYLIDLATWTLTSREFPVGYAAGHADFSNQLNKVCITNHKGQYVTIIDLNDDTTTNIQITDTPETGAMLQTHANIISPDGKFFYIFDVSTGTYVEIDIENEVVTRTTTVGGKPVQTTS